MSQQKITCRIWCKVEIMDKNKGRPTKYRPEMCTILEAMMRQGASHIEVIAEIDI